MARKISYTHNYDLLWKLGTWFLYLLALFVCFGIADIVSAPLEEISKGLRLIFGIIIFIFGLVLFFKIILSGDYLPTKWYVKNNFNIELDKKECLYLSLIFSGNGYNRWYPLKEIADIPESQRKEALFNIAKGIIGMRMIRQCLKRKKRKSSFL